MSFAASLSSISCLTVRKLTYWNVEMELKNVLRWNVFVRISIHEQVWKWILFYIFVHICSYMHHKTSNVSLKRPSEMIWYKAYIRIINLIRAIGTNLHLHRHVRTKTPMKMQQTERSEMLTCEIQTPRNYPEDSIQRSEQWKFEISNVIFSP